jgi:hypothetical protein
LEGVPQPWFSVETKAVGGALYLILKAMATNDHATYQKLLQQEQSISLLTAVGSQVETIAQFFFGDTLPRFTGETDSAYKTRIVNFLFERFGTRQGMYNVLNAALGTPPVIHERNDLLDTFGGYLAAQDGYLPTAYPSGGYYSPGQPIQNYGGIFAYDNASTPWAHPYGPYTGIGGQLGYNVHGTWLLEIGPYQALIDVQQPEPVDPHFLRYNQIMALITLIKPLGTVSWVKVIGPPSNGGLPLL